MTTPQIVLFAILASLFALLAWGRFRYDIVAFCALMACVLAGLVPAKEAFLGFGHPATVTVAAVLILSQALSASGATDSLARLIKPATRNTTLHVGALSGLGGLMSTFMNNVGTLGLLMPTAIESASATKRAIALLLMPLSFGAILGGLITMIGTPPNIIIATYRAEVSGEPFGLFDFTPVGLGTAVVGVLFIAFIGWRLVPVRDQGASGTSDRFDIENYVTELRVPKDSEHIVKTLREIDQLTEDIDAVVVDLIRGERRFPGGSWHKELAAGDVLKIEAGPDDMDKFITRLGLELSESNARPASAAEAKDKTLAEVVIAPGSRLEGRTVGSIRLFANRGVSLLAVSRQGTPFRGRLKSFRLRIGDVLLLHGAAEGLPDAVSATGCLPLAERQITFGKRRQARILIGIFAAAILATTFGILPIQISLGLAVAGAVVSGLIAPRELYDGIDWPVIVLLGALIPVGGALETSGATDVIAGAILALTDGFSAAVVLALIMIVTMTLSDVLNNAATAVVMAPIGVTIAERLGVSSDPFLMAVAVAASCAFLTPIGHQNNALILGPGGYRFGDYWRMGLPLEIIVIAVSLPLIMIFWPL
ncbi:MAG: SLC13 family permease [Pseudomonadota bacterium]